MYSKVNVTIIDVIGNKVFEAALPIDVQVWRIIEELIRRMNYPTRGPTGGLGSMIFYSFSLQSSGVHIKNEQTLADAGVQDNEILRLEPRFLPCDCPNCYPTKKITIKKITSNRVLEVALLTEVPVIMIINRLVQIFGLKTSEPGGEKIKYYFVQKSSGKPIPDGQTLAGAGVKERDVLILGSEIEEPKRLKPESSEIELSESENEAVNKKLDQSLVEAKNSKLNVTIIDALSNKEIEAALPKHVEVIRISFKLSEKIGLPLLDSDGKLISYKFHIPSGKSIPDEQTLAGAGVRDGDLLILRPETVEPKRLKPESSEAELSEPETEAGNKKLDQSLVEANNSLGINIFLELAKVGEGQNLIISPVSIIIALGIAYNGSDSETRLAMEKTLQFEDMGIEELNTGFAGLLKILNDLDSEVELNVANSLWVRKGIGFNEDFLQRNRDYFKAKVAELDFSGAEAASTINNWVCENTRNRFDSIVDPPISDNSMLLLINTMYFRGQWSIPFLKSMTRDETFNLTGGKVKKHPTMYSVGDFYYLKNDLFQAIKLPYGENERVNMYVYLPALDKGLEGFCGELNGANWKKWIGSFNKKNGMLGLPRFKLGYETSLKKTLAVLGMGRAFDEISADFSGISSLQTQLYMSDFKHKTLIEVNEEGTEAAAATAIEIFAGGTINMIIDRPFFFSIVDNMTGIILFMGMVLEPKT